MKPNQLAPARLVCPKCDCYNGQREAWNQATQTLEGELGEVMAEGWGLYPSGDCDCPCHTGVGLLPRLHLKIGSATP